MICSGLIHVIVSIKLFHRKLPLYPILEKNRGTAYPYFVQNRVHVLQDNFELEGEKVRVKNPTNSFVKVDFRGVDSGVSG